jgi:hypothetical protein
MGRSPDDPIPVAGRHRDNHGDHDNGDDDRDRPGPRDSALPGLRLDVHPDRSGEVLLERVPQAGV